MRKRTVILVGLAIAVLIGFYVHGSFDRALSGIGLNFHECKRNGLGATFCGKELDELRERLQGVQAKLQAIKANTKTTESTSTSTPSLPSERPSGKVTVSPIPESEEIQARITVTHPPCASETYCGWTSAATQYPPLPKCPGSIDTSHIFWNGPVQTSAGTVHQTTAFKPVRENRLLICLYVHDSTAGDQLAYGLHVG